MNEVEVIYINEKGQYKERKFKRYKGMDNALTVYRQTINKLRDEGTFALIVLRKFQHGYWVLEKSERV